MLFVPFFASAQSIPHRADLHQSDDWAQISPTDNSAIDATTGWVTNLVAANTAWTPSLSGGVVYLTYGNRAQFNDHGSLYIFNPNLLGRDTTQGSQIGLYIPIFNSGAAQTPTARFRATPAHSGVESFVGRVTIEATNGTSFDSYMKIIDGKMGLGIMNSDPTAAVDINAPTLRIRMPSAAMGNVLTAMDALGNSVFQTAPVIYTSVESYADVASVVANPNSLIIIKVASDNRTGSMVANTVYQLWPDNTLIYVTSSVITR